MQVKGPRPSPETGEAGRKGTRSTPRQEETPCPDEVYCPGTGDRRDERSGKEHGARWTERPYGSFVRTIPIPCEVEADRVEASFRRGVLTVALPKTAEARCRTRRIEVRAG